VVFIKAIKYFSKYSQDSGTLGSKAA